MSLFDSIIAPLNNAVQNVGNAVSSSVKPPSLQSLGAGVSGAVNFLGQAAGEGPNSSGLGTLLNVATQYATGGLLGYDPSAGKFGEGVGTHAADEGVGAVDGRNTARDALAQQSAALNQAAAAQAQDLKNTQLLNQESDITASTSAKANQSAVAASSQAVLGSYAQGTSPDERNFLGL